MDDNEAVIRMIKRGRSPTLGNVSRTHSVDLDWLVERIDLDRSISIRYVRTAEQLEDILTKGTFTTTKTSLMQLFDSRPPRPELNVDCSCSDSHSSAVSQQRFVYEVRSASEQSGLHQQELKETPLRKRQPVTHNKK